MKLHSFCFLAGIVLSTVFAEYFVVKPSKGGVNSSSGPRPFRKDITELQGAELDLYLLALQELQQAQQEEKLSWFQLAGIHGYPAVDWDGAKRTSGNSRVPGYGIHTCQLFLPWHRAYLLLLENVISLRALTIAKRYPDTLRDHYIEAANNLRLPYWSWDGSSGSLPAIVASAQVSVLQPDGIQATIKNPLESYTFHPPMPMSQVGGDTTFYRRSATVRQPDSSGQSNYDWVQGNLTGFYTSNRNFLLQGFTDSSSIFSDWSNTAGNSGQSVEIVHGAAHSALGGFMYDLYASSFDPVFFLHHANVDRQWAIWAAIHPDSWFVQRPCYGSSYTHRAGTIENETSPLTPFRANSIGNFHTPKSMRHVRNLGYAYREVPDWQFDSPTALRDYVLGIVTQQYSPAGVLAASVASTAASTPRQWSIDIKIQTDTTSPANVFFFIGVPPQQRDQWIPSNNLVFAQAFLANHAGGQRSARVPITSYLTTAVNRKKLKDLTPESVKPFLKDQLHWRVIVSGGSDTINLQGDQQMLVKIVEQKVLSISKGMKQYGPITVHSNLTWTAQEDY